MANRISKRELEMLERDRRENCGDKGFRFMQRRGVGIRLVSDRQRVKTDREMRNKRLKKQTMQSQILPKSMKIRRTRRQRRFATARPATNASISPADTIQVLQKQNGQTTSTKAYNTATAQSQFKVSGAIKAVSVGDICVRTKNDKGFCCISGSVILPDNKLIYMYTDHINPSIRQVNIQTSKVTAELKTSSDPWDVTVINEASVAVTFPFSEKIMIVKVTDQLTMDKELTVDGECRAILHNNGDLIVSYCNPSKIEILSLDGKVKRKIAHSESFQKPNYMVLSQDSQTIFVSDFQGNCVTRLSLDGSVEATYKDKKLGWPEGLVLVGQQDRLLVCGWGSHNIHLLKPDLSKIKVPMQGIYHPQCLSYCHSTGRLYVGTWGFDNIKVYQLS